MEITCFQRISTLWGRQNTISTASEPSTRFAVVATDHTNIFKPRTRFLSNLCKPPTHFVMVKTYLSNLWGSQNALAHFAVAKGYSPKLCKPPTPLGVVTTHSPKFYKPPICGSQNAPSKALQASYMLCGDLLHTLQWWNALYKSLQVYYWLKHSLRSCASLLHGQDALSKRQEASYTLFKPPTCFDVEKTLTTN